MSMSPDAYLFWGVCLSNGEYGEIHDSLRPPKPDEDAPLGEWEEYEAHEYPWQEYPNLTDGLPVRFEIFGYDYSTDNVYLVLERGYFWASGWGTKEVDPAQLYPPTDDEISIINTVLHEIGYTGPNELKLTLACNYG